MSSRTESGTSLSLVPFPIAFLAERIVYDLLGNILFQLFTRLNGVAKFPLLILSINVVREKRIISTQPNGYTTENLFILLMLLGITEINLMKIGVANRL